MDLNDEQYGHTHEGQPDRLAAITLGKKPIFNMPDIMAEWPNENVDKSALNFARTREIAAAGEKETILHPSVPNMGTTLDNSVQQALAGNDPSTASGGLDWLDRFHAQEGHEELF